MSNDNNIYCRHCGEKFLTSVQKCPMCNTNVINDRVSTDNKWVIYLVFNIVLIILGVKTMFYLLFIPAYILIFQCYNAYSNNVLVKLIFYIEKLIIILFLCIIFLSFSPVQF